MTHEPNSKLPEFPAAAESPWISYLTAAPVPVTHEHRPRALFLAAHPDDETIGASAALRRLPGAIVVYVTDGAPHDPRFRSSFTGSREDYVRARRCEAEAA
ncbi:MAG TPA: PIG-L family deacetylase, partial [Terriglobales bacterium]|nr:PIG-L family deacetylase [Terriglobales bacterium]